jgi:hypothetical protein
MLNVFVLALLVLPIQSFGASTSEIPAEKYSPTILNQHGVLRFENSEKISYTAYGESCTHIKFADIFEHEDLNGIKTQQSAHSVYLDSKDKEQFFASYAARRFAALEIQFEGK